MVDVTQADRDRAVWLLPDVFDARVRKGKMDDHSIVQAFAMHRIEAYAAGQRDALAHMHLPFVTTTSHRGQQGEG